MDANERGSRRLRRLGGLFQQAGQVAQALAEDLENPLAGSRSPGLLCGNGTNTMKAKPAQQPIALLSAKEVAEFLGVCKKTVQRWRALGKIPPAIPLHGRLRWRLADLENWLRELEERR